MLRTDLARTQAPGASEGEGTEMYSVPNLPRTWYRASPVTLHSSFTQEPTGQGSFHGTMCHLAQRHFFLLTWLCNFCRNHRARMC